MGMSLTTMFVYSPDSLFFGNYAVPVITLHHNSKCLGQKLELRKPWES